jgi:hypothetical protein
MSAIFLMIDKPKPEPCSEGFNFENLLNKVFVFNGFALPVLLKMN